MKRFITPLACLVALLVFSASCNVNKTAIDNCPMLKKGKDGKTILRLQQQWYANSGFAGELFAQSKTAARYGLSIDITPGSDQIDTKQVVKLGEADIGVAGAEQVMLANENGADLVVIGVITYKSLACFISKKEKHIWTPKDFKNHRIGTMEGSPVDLIYQVLKKKENLEIDKALEVPTGWVLTGFEQNQYDVYPAFINDEPVTLKMKGIEVNVIEPSNFGITFVGTVYFCKRALAQSCPEAVQGFVNAIAEGWSLALQDPNGAIALLKAYDGNIDEQKELESLIKGADYYKGEDGKMLYAKEESWNRMAELLKSIGYLKTFNYQTTVDDRFITWYHSRVKKD